MAAAVHAARASPPRLQPLHSLPPTPSLTMTHPPHPSVYRGSAPSNTMDRKQYFSVCIPDNPLPSLSFHHPLPPLPPPPLPFPQPSYDDEVIDEDVDEDEMSDLEEEQELLAYHRRWLEPNMTRQLLNFADRVSADVHKFFGHKKGDEDSCDVYEDKWTVTKSGRELYYADLLKIAQGDFGDSKSSSKKSSETSRNKSISEDNRHSFSGKADLNLGLGPLEELFDYGSQLGKQKKSTSQHTTSKRTKTDSDTSTWKLVPMHKRSFPDSFWHEPGTASHIPPASSSLDVPVASSSDVHTLSSSKLPDFSDLMDSWHGEQAQLQQQQQIHNLQPMSHPHPHPHPHTNHQQRPSVLDTTLSSDPSRKRKL